MASASAATKKHNNSAIISITCRVQLPHLLKNGKNLDETTVKTSFKTAREALNKECTIKVKQATKISLKYPKDVAKSTLLVESLYDSADVPPEVSQKGDYLPQMSKAEKEKELQKWRNKQKNKREQLDFEIALPGCESLVPGIDGEHYNQQLYGYAHLPLKTPVPEMAKSLLGIVNELLNCIEQCLTRFYVSFDRPFQAATVYSFKNEFLEDFVYVAYPQRYENKELVREFRRELHEKYQLPMDRPLLRPANQYHGREGNPDQQSGYLCNVHISLTDSLVKGGAKSVIQGTYTYHHYMQDKINDSGWGCAYRSLQTIVSWFKHQGYIDEGEPDFQVPSHRQIQQALVDVGDKQPSFVGSEKWIGSQEVCYVLNQLYQIESKIISVSSGSELVYKARELSAHFSTHSTPVMIGGGVLAHAIIGVDFNEKSGDTSFLVLDPHYTGAEDLATIQKKGWCGWKKTSFWEKNAFYNLCLPQRPSTI